MKTLLITAAVFAAPLAAPAAAAPGETRRDVSVKIADLDLGTPEGIAALDRRLARAVLKACGTAHYLEPQQLEAVDRCRAGAHERAMATREALLSRRSGPAAANAGALQ